MRPTIFIGSSTESLELARAIKNQLHHDADVTVWYEGIFDLSKSVLESLVEAKDNFDFGIFILSPDDLLKIRRTEISAARDNVVFELGLFIGTLGRNRVFFVIPDNVEDFHLPTDLLGMTPARYQTERTDKNIDAAVGDAVYDIRKIVRTLGPQKKTTSQIFYSTVRESPDLTSLLERAKSDIIICTSTGSYIRQNLKTKIFEAMARGVIVKLLIMANTSVTAELIGGYAGVYDFKDEIELCHLTYQKWLENAKGENLPFEIRLTPIVPLVLNIVDGSQNDGEIYIMPVPYDMRPIDRPCYYLDRSIDEVVFERMLRSVNSWWDNSEILPT